MHYFMYGSKRNSNSSVQAEGEACSEGKYPMYLAVDRRIGHIILKYDKPGAFFAIYFINIECYLKN